jgi:mannose/fructose/N-acetylgalactosamine-specific phosphotransferase system component IIC
MPFDLGTVLALALLGGLIAIDGTSLGQFMVSRPFVAAILGGWVAGSPENGAVIGLVLETFQLGVRPVGAARYPEGGPAAVAAGAVYASTDPTAATLIIVTIGALMLERLGGETIHYMRLANVGIVNRMGSFPTAANLERSHIASIGMDFGRGVLLVTAGTALLETVARYVVPFWGLSDRVSGILLMTSVVALLAGSLRMLGSKFLFAAAGAAIGLVALLFGV